ncbi:hypothetical protein D0Z00_001562 [Geotrichum galactomycetum]|uniref:Uncharacterized protein n=1 Tax=Geotrichum galactomycetum TaxID=27317 RepID=A0ACB6V6K9_9ASCO|nr:hypothetical protein D0Z00_001562 [Geotrichum candidum]
MPTMTPKLPTTNGLKREEFSPFKPSYLSPPPPTSSSPFRRASAIEVENSLPLHHNSNFNHPFSNPSTPQHFSPIIGNNSANHSGVTSGIPSGIASPVQPNEPPSSNSILDRFANLGQITMNAELASNGMKQVELNADATPLPPPHSNHQSRHGSFTSFQSPSIPMESFSPFVSPSLSHAYTRSNSTTATPSMWHQQVNTPISSSSTLVNGFSNLDVSNAESSSAVPPAITRSPFYSSNYASVFSSPANSIVGISENNNWPDESHYRSPPPTLAQSLDARLSPAAVRTSPAPRLAAVSANADRNLRQQLAQQIAQPSPLSQPLMTDVFGNYVIQKFFELGNQVQKSIIAKQMEGNVLRLSLQMYGCRVVQKAIEHVLTDQQAVLIKELDGHVLQCVKDQNGNHVVQKAIESIPAKHIAFIIDAFQDQVFPLATHPYGCRVIQRMLEHCEPTSKRMLLSELHKVIYDLIEDQYGNYVVQHVIERGYAPDKEKVMMIVCSSILAFSRHKFASNVVEKCIIYGSDAQRDRLIEEILRPQQPAASAAAAASAGAENAGPAAANVVPLTIMMKDQFGNYVIQKLLEVTTAETRQHTRLIEAIRPLLHQLKKVSYGKHLASIEKLVI